MLCDSFFPKLHTPLHQLSAGQRRWLKPFKIIYWAAQEFLNHKCSQQASSLTYLTLMAIVPILALIFGIAKGFGLEVVLERFIVHNLQGQELFATKIISFAHTMLANTQGGIIAGIGVFLLLWTVLRIMDTIEKAFNDLWNISVQRPIFRRCINYLAFMLICPFVIVLSSSLTVVLKSHLASSASLQYILHWIPGIVIVLLHILPYAVMSLLFAFLYIAVPHTHIAPRSALYGGVAAGVTYQLTQVLYVFLQTTVSSYGAIYGSFAAIPFFLVWLQLSWLIMLGGAEVAFAHQNVLTLDFKAREERFSPEVQKILLLRVLHLLIHNFCSGHNPLNLNELNSRLHVPPRTLANTVNMLMDLQLINHVKEPHEGYQPAVDPHTLTIADVIKRYEQKDLHRVPSEQPESFAPFDRHFQDMHTLINQTSANKNFLDIKLT